MTVTEPANPTSGSVKLFKVAATATPFLVFTLIAVLMTGCHITAEKNVAYQPEMSKIQFPLDNIDADGLRGPPDGLVAVSYEFCVPTDESIYQEVQRIDPTIQMHAGAPGRISCTANQSLALGATHQARWREVLQELSSLNYVDEIRECFFE
jgi:hypothetical protein